MEDNIKMDVQEVEFGNMDWIGLAHDRERWRAVVNAVMIITQLRAVSYFYTSTSNRQSFCIEEEVCLCFEFRTVDRQTVLVFLVF